MSSTAVEDDSDEDIPYVMTKPRHVSASAAKALTALSEPSAPAAPKPARPAASKSTAPVAPKLAAPAASKSTAPVAPKPAAPLASNFKTPSVVRAKPGPKPKLKEVAKPPPKPQAAAPKRKSSSHSESDNTSDSSSDHDSDVETDEDESTSSEDDNESEEETRPAKRAKPLDTPPIFPSHQLRDSISRALQPTSLAVGLSGVAAKLKTLEATLDSESNEKRLEAFTDLFPPLIDALCTKPTLEQAQLRHVSRSLQGIWQETLPKLEILTSIAKEQQQSAAKTLAALSELLGTHLGVAGTLAHTLEHL